MATEYVGLRKMRAVQGKVPTYACPNCNCKRYTVCTCKRGVDKAKPQKENKDVV